MENTLGISQVCICNVSQDMAASRAFYDKLGFRKEREQEGFAVLTDGEVYLMLQKEIYPTNGLLFLCEDLKNCSEVLASRGVPTADKGSFLLGSDINGIPLFFDEASKYELPDLPQTNISLCGRLGEFSFISNDLHSSISFWQKLEFVNIITQQSPYRLSILTNKKLKIGIHNTDMWQGSNLTYLASNMADRIAQVKDAGLPLAFELTGIDGRATNAGLKSPDGQGFFLFEGE